MTWQPASHYEKGQKLVVTEWVCHCGQHFLRPGRCPRSRWWNRWRHLLDHGEYIFLAMDEVAE